jgi:tyrosine decarboxylase/aspartate 1-decarboxylase
MVEIVLGMFHKDYRNIKALSMIINLGVETMLAERGTSREDVLKELDEVISRDATYSSGQPTASMSTIPHEIGTEVYVRTLEKNAGRLHTFRGSAEIEQEVISMISDLLHLRNPYGTTTSGGTESNILSILAAREIAPRRIDSPEIIAPKTVHTSIDKAAWLLGVKVVKTKVDKEFRAIPSEIADAINDNTIGISITAGTTYLGQVDPIDEIGRIASENGIPLHVDAAFGGFVIPFLNELGMGDFRFDFSVRGVTSMSSDPHKMGLAPIPSGSIIFRHKRFVKAITRKIPYLRGASSTQTSILGTRPAASVLATWAVMKHLGREGYRNIVRECMRRTFVAKERVQSSPLLKLAINPVMNILGIQSKERPLAQIVEEMEEKGWKMATSPFPPTIRIVVMPHITEESIHALFNDLDAVASTIR